MCFFAKNLWFLWKSYESPRAILYMCVDIHIYLYIYIYTLEESPPLEPLGPHVEDLGQQFEFILAPFWQPLGTLGTTLGAIGHHLGNLVDPRVKIRSSVYPPGQLRFHFSVHSGVTCCIKSVYFRPKMASHNNPTIKCSVYLIFVAISMTPGPWILSSRLHGSTIFKKLPR